MTTRTGLRNVQRIHFRARVTGRTKVMHTVAVDAHRDLVITLRQAPAMHTGLVLGQLVRAQRWVVLTHKGGIGMATAAYFGNLLALDLTAEPSRLAHGIQVGPGGIAAVATGACQSLLGVNVTGESFLRYLERRI